MRSALRIVIGVCSFAMWTGMSYAQSKEDRLKIDSVFKLIDARTDDTAKVTFIINQYNDYLWQFNLPETFNRLRAAAKLAARFHFDKGELLAYGAMSSYCSRVGANSFALQNRIKCKEIALRMGDSARIMNVYLGLGFSYQGAGQYDSAMHYYSLCRKALENSDDKDRLARLYLFMNWLYHSQGKTDSALIYARKSLELRKEINYFDGIMSSLGSMFAIYQTKKQYDSAIWVQREVLKYAKDRNDAGGNGRAYMAIGDIYQTIEQKDSAAFYFRKAFGALTSVNAPDYKRDIFRRMTDVRTWEGDEKAALEFYRQYLALKDSLSTDENRKVQQRTKEIYDLESKNAELELVGKDTEMKEKEIEFQRRSLWGMGSILGIAIVLGFVTFRGYRQKKKTTRILGERKLIIEEKNRDITNSIVYAQRIQEAMLPSVELIRKAFPASFVFYQPKAIVSGDLFWFNETEEEYHLAVADCTGHGVPGAMMSMIGFNFLGQIVNEMKIREPHRVLNELHRRVLNALHRDSGEGDVKDGMDVALVRIPKTKTHIDFAGASRPLFISSASGSRMIKGDIFSIGGVKDIEKESFSLHSINAEPGSSYFLFTDGYADQFGGPGGKKFKSKRLTDLVGSLYDKTPAEQGKIIEKTFHDWKMGHEQVDDVTIIGFQLK